MKTEKDKMLAGELYNASDPVLTTERKLARILLHRFNHSGPEELVLQKKILHELFGEVGNGLYIEPPFYCDYGYNMILGKNVYFNFNCIVLDVQKVVIGNNVLVGPGVHIYTASHPVDYRERATGLEFSKPVVVGDDVWLGGGVILCPGVTIGTRTVIGAGSVVTRNIPSDVFAAGNPCRTIRSLEK